MGTLTMIQKKSLFIFILTVLCVAFAQTSEFNPKSLAYILQADQFQANRSECIELLAKAERDCIVIDYMYDGSEEGKWTAAEIKKFRGKKSDTKVLAYISIGEAEDYRPYWKKNWDQDKNGKPDQEAPIFLNQMNPEWQGNYKVRYWQAEWQKIILQYLDEILLQEFDGIYLYIVDAFEFYEYDPISKKWVDNLINPETQKSYRDDMIQWVLSIVEYTHQKNPQFLIIPQNGSQLLTSSEYANGISGIGLEDVFTNDHKKQEQDHTEFILQNIKPLQKMAKPVFIIEYTKNKELQEYCIKKAYQYNFVLLITNRALTQIGISNKPQKKQ